MESEDGDGEPILQELEVESSDSIFQLKGYALQALMENPERNLVRLYLGWLRERYYIVATYTRDEILTWWESLQYRIRTWDGKTFAPGLCCRWCRNAVGCPGGEKYLGTAVKIFCYPQKVKFPGGRASLALDDPRRIEAEKHLTLAYEQCKVLEANIAIYRANFKQEIAAGGPIPDGNGKAIGLIDVKGKTVIDASPAWKTLVEHFGGNEDELKKLVTISSSTLKKAIKDRSDKGDKQHAVDRLITDLEAKNAVIYKPGYQRFGMIKDTRHQPAIDI